MAAINPSPKTHAEPYSANNNRYKAARARCAQCGTEMRYVPFALANIMCRDCYGMDRYRRPSGGTPAPEKPVEVTATDEAATTVTA